MGLKEDIVAILEQHGTMKFSAILKALSKRVGKPVPSTSLSGRLSELKKRGVLTHDELKNRSYWLVSDEVEPEPEAAPALPPEKESAEKESSDLDPDILTGRQRQSFNLPGGLVSRLDAIHMEGMKRFGRKDAPSLSDVLSLGLSAILERLESGDVSTWDALQRVREHIKQRSSQGRPPSE